MQSHRKPAAAQSHLRSPQPALRSQKQESAQCPLGFKTQRVSGTLCGMCHCYENETVLGLWKRGDCSSIFSHERSTSTMQNL